jgi:hypothetical protein
MLLLLLLPQTLKQSLVHLCVCPRIPAVWVHYEDHVDWRSVLGPNLKHV